MTDADWLTRYSTLTQRLPAAGDIVSDRVFLCGMSACVDVCIDLHDAQPLLEVPATSPAAPLRDMLMDRVARGIGGEVLFDWPEGPTWLYDHVTLRHALGGTGPQAAWVLASLGLPALISLEDRDDRMIAPLPPAALLAQGDQIIPAAMAERSPRPAPETFIFEYTAGQPAGDITPTRSSRIIVRFADRGMQRDKAFFRASAALAGTAAAGLLSGLNEEPAANIAAACDEMFGLGRAWRKAGLATVHLELAGYSSARALDTVLASARGAATSLGMSQSELKGLAPETADPGADIAPALIALGERLGMNRVCVHADEWAAAVTLDDPADELHALMTGCAVAAARAASGHPVDRVAIDPRARFHALSFAPRRIGRWNFVVCPAPHLVSPRTTLGLGDSFTAGCLLVLGGAAPQLATMKG